MVFFFLFFLNITSVRKCFKAHTTPPASHQSTSVTEKINARNLLKNINKQMSNYHFSNGKAIYSIFLSQRKRKPWSRTYTTVFQNSLLKQSIMLTASVMDKARGGDKMSCYSSILRYLPSKRRIPRPSLPNRVEEGMGEQNKAVQ